jgi:hypothetical protein
VSILKEFRVLRIGRAYRERDKTNPQDGSGAKYLKQGRIYGTRKQIEIHE